jgi:multicomponent Na+:H+ antiporter subunit G
MSELSTAAAVFISIGVVFDLIGGLGLIRLPDIYNRLQGATKCVTLGTCFILLGVLIQFGFTSMGIKAILCLAFVLMTSPTAAHAISKGSHAFGIKLWEGSVIDKLAEDKSKE